MVKDPRAILARADATLAEVMQAVKALDGEATLRVGVAANITAELLGVYLRRHAHLAGVCLSVTTGHYDDLLGDLARFARDRVELALVVPFFDNLVASFEAQVEARGAQAAGAVVDDYLARLDVALASARELPSVIIVGSHAWQAANTFDARGTDRELLRRFNSELRALGERYAHVRYLDGEDVLQQVGARAAFDARFYYRGKAPYTPAFWDELARRVRTVTRDFGSRFFKVLVLDCDNTLWGGILGEDGADGVKLDPHSYPGNVFWNVQQQLVALEQSGVLICLCTKNNLADVDEMLQSHPHMPLRPQHIVASRINWDDKVTNLRSLAAQLNVGLDSFVFIDDAEFELEAVRAQLPEVQTFRVPERLTEYPGLLRQVGSLFVAGGVSRESASKTDQYRALESAQRSSAGFASHEAYLRSLAIQLRIAQDERAHTERATELINKSNQFNLTTLRLSAGEVARCMEADGVRVYTLSVRDKLLDHGLTGVLITEDSDDAVSVRAFLLSCRVLGRGVEFGVWKRVLADARVRGKKRLRARYVPTAKNAQVADFYDRLGFGFIGTEESGARIYEVSVDEAHLAECSWLEVVNG